MKNDGGAAFPIVIENEHPWDYNPGMTPRDWFAGKLKIEEYDIIRIADISETHCMSRADAEAIVRYEKADAMLAAREK